MSKTDQQESRELVPWFQPLESLAKQDAQIRALSKWIRSVCEEAGCKQTSKGIVLPARTELTNDEYERVRHLARAWAESARLGDFAKSGELNYEIVQAAIGFAVAAAKGHYVTPVRLAKSKLEASSKGGKNRRVPPEVKQFAKDRARDYMRSGKRATWSYKQAIRDTQREFPDARTFTWRTLQGWFSTRGY